MLFQEVRMQSELLWKLNSQISLDLWVIFDPVDPEQNRSGHFSPFQTP